MNNKLTRTLNNQRAICICALAALFSFCAAPASGQTDKEQLILDTFQYQKDIVYKTVGRKQLDLDYFKPQNLKAGEKAPWMLFVHGGGWRGGNKYNVLRSAFAGTLKQLTEQGIACFTIEYRLTRNGVTAFDTVVDCKDAARFLLKNAATYNLDTQRYGVWGGSAGGHLSLMTALGKNADFPGDATLKEFPLNFKCVASYYPLTSLVNPEVLAGSKFEDPAVLLHVLDGPFAEKPELARLLSPVEYLTKTSPPILLLHGEKDSTLSIKNSQFMMEVAKEKGADVELLTVKNAGHSFGGKDISPSLEKINTKSAQFIIARLTSVAGAMPPLAIAGDQRQSKVVCFGDSITKRGFPKILGDLLKVESINAGVAGNSTAKALRRMDSDVLKHAPNVVVVICFGANDSRMAEQKVYVRVEQYEINLTKMVVACKRRNMQPVLCTLPPINADKYFERHEREKFDQAGGLAKVLDSYRLAALRVAKVNQIPAIDLHRLLAEQPAWLSFDGVHPSAKGNRIIAKLVAEKIRGLIKMQPASAAVTTSTYDAQKTLSSARAQVNTLPADANVDVVIYGGTSAGVIAAIQASRMGQSVVLIEPTQRVGGMTSGGLGNTDVGKPETIGGITREFYQDIHLWYQNQDHWKLQPQQEFLDKADQKRISPDAMFVFEPHVAEVLLCRMLAKAKVPVVFGERLDLKDGVKKQGTKIVSIRMESGRVFTGQVFLDCSYEGDLMAKSGVAYTVGREGNAKYGEFINGVQTTEPPRGRKPIDPFVIPGDPTSGVIKGLVQDVVGKEGDGDKLVQAYNYRMCLTNMPKNRTPFDKPADYDEQEFELLFRWLEAGNTRGLPVGLNPIPNGKTDSNKAGWVSTDYIGYADNYPDADHAEREQIVAAHVRYHKGFLWTLANHPRVPDTVRRRASAWGYAKDEFQDSGNFARQLYVREGRRMLGQTIITEHELKKRRQVLDPVALGSYGMDSHPTQLWVGNDGLLHADTPKWTGVGPYGISYQALTPKSDQCSNLLVPVCVSASHSAYGSLRMEPVYMMLGQAAATAAVLALQDEANVQEVPYSALRKQLIADGQLLAPKTKPK